MMMTIDEGIIFSSCSSAAFFRSSGHVLLPYRYISRTAWTISMKGNIP